MGNNKDYLIAKLTPLIRELISAPDDEAGGIAEEVERLSPDPEIMNYIFWSNEYLDEHGKVDIERLVDKILECKPIVL